jgi:hypothetical protein
MQDDEQNFDLFGEVIPPAKPAPADVPISIQLHGAQIAPGLSSGGESQASSEPDNGGIAGNIRKFIAEKHSGAEYAAFVRSLYTQTLARPPEDPIFKLLDHYENKNESDFYTAPASTHFHGAHECGLIKHSLLVTANAIHLSPAIIGENVDNYNLITASLFHDLCKVNMYQVKMRNAKNDKTGEWEKVPFYSVRDDYLVLGHGIESMLRINEFVSLPQAWNYAVRWHMGAYDLSPSDSSAMKKALETFREVLLLQTADLEAAMLDEA